MKSRQSSRWLMLAMLVAALTLVLATPAEAKRYMTTGFRNLEDRPVNIALLPPHAEFIKAKAVMTEQMVKECKGLEEAAAKWIDQHLRDKGYTVRIVSAEDLLADSELSELMLRANARFNEEWAKLIRRPKKIKYERYNAGEPAQELAALLGVDGVIFPRVQAVGVTGGKKALAGILSLGYYVPQGYARLDLTVVEGSTGDVEAYFFYAKPSNLKPLVRKPDKVMMQVAQKAMKKYPLKDEALPIKNIPVEAEDEGAADEATVLGELELLLGPAEAEPEEEEEETGETAEPEEEEAGETTEPEESEAQPE